MERIIKDRDVIIPVIFTQKSNIMTMTIKMFRKYLTVHISDNVK